ncbi:tRNA dimethylallyltransferase [Lentibacillus persicus]|uniref:tRNA dimethylallyltransferase n=1 Tax=Lentibacillus persicus TaxID=640948 RepID=A0A1I1V7G8_9BACI|nr:tRNA (adenosine(37)-N6)-dimethylallyltransferase MiaA [Lentibacillus persicus]SFD78785.1 tRNA dimethylallyltransferase [Lentibacillus persicus]
MKKTIIAIVGPTAVGKTSLSLEVANRFNGEVISGDSMQVYQGLDIGTAKVTEEERENIPHYMIDIKNPAESFSVADYQSYVQHYIEKIDSRGKLPVIAGGSGLYIQAALYNYQFSDKKRDPELTGQLEKKLEEQGSGVLYEQLKQVDPEQAAKIHPNNHRRLIRALEVYESTGKTMTEFQRTQRNHSPYNPIFIGLEMDRERLYQRINKRIDEMLAKGLVEEAKSLYDQGYENYQAMRGIGYKEFIPYFKGEQPFNETVQLLKRNSRRYAKRQYTWFKNKMDVNWYTVSPEHASGVFENILADLAGMLQKI